MRVRGRIECVDRVVNYWKNWYIALNEVELDEENKKEKLGAVKSGWRGFNFIYLCSGTKFCVESADEGGFSRESGYTLKKGGRAGRVFFQGIHCFHCTKGANGSNGGDGTSRSPLFCFRIARKTSPLKNSTFSKSPLQSWVDRTSTGGGIYTSIYLLARPEFSCFLAIKDYRAFIYLFLLPDFKDID